MSSIKTLEEVKKIAVASQLADNILYTLIDNAKVGVSTYDLSVLAEDLANKYECELPCIGYMGFPAGICTSLNTIAIHGIPSKSDILREGDVLHIDIVVKKDGYCGDCSASTVVREKFEELSDADMLIMASVHVTYETISRLKAGIKLSKVPEFIEEAVKDINDLYPKNIVRVIEKFCSHCIGTEIHENFYIHHTTHEYNEFNKEDITLEKGMVFTIEPALTYGRNISIATQGGWSEYTGDINACREHTVVIGKDRAHILTDNDYNIEEIEQWMI